MKKTIKNYLVLSAGAFSFIVSFVLFVKSFYKEDYGEYGVDISFNTDYVVALIMSSAVIAYAIYKLVAAKKGNEDTKNALVLTVFTIGAVGCGYNLGVFLKALMKAIEKQKEFDFAAKQNYLYLGIMFTIVAIYFAFDLIEIYKNSSED